MNQLQDSIKLLLSIGINYIDKYRKVYEEQMFEKKT